MSISGRCHCGRNGFEIAGELPEKLTFCTCSLCSKRGHLYAGAICTPTARLSNRTEAGMDGRAGSP